MLIKRFSALYKYSDFLAEGVGYGVRFAIELIGSLTRFFFKIIKVKWRPVKITEQMFLLGNKSLSFVTLSSVFVGFITIMSYLNLTDRLFVPPSIMGMMVSRVVFMELGPALVGLILAGKIGAKIASEIAYMRISDQIDALSCLSLNPESYLIIPRVLACFFMGPVFFVTSALTAIIASQIFAELVCGIHAATFYSGMKNAFEMKIIIMGLVKVTVFSTTNAIVGCFYGYSASKGASGVGKATRDTVVTSSLLILFENIVLTKVII